MHFLEDVLILTKHLYVGKPHDKPSPLQWPLTKVSYVFEGADIFT